MKSLYVKDTLEDLQKRIEKLRPDTQRQWGKMSVSQMLEHCCVPLEIALGERQLSVPLMMRMFGPLMKGFMTNQKPFPKNMRTPKDFIPGDTADFDVNKKRLIGLLQRFHDDGGKGMASRRHPVFGWLTAEEWSDMNYKHLDHHLRQFGV